MIENYKKLSFSRGIVDGTRLTSHSNGSILKNLHRSSSKKIEMSLRSFSTSIKRLIQQAGSVSLADIQKLNGSKGDKWVDNVVKVTESVEREVSLQ